MMEEFEKNIRQHFQDREIKPSENAWERMEQMLNEKQVEKKKTTLFFFLLPIAASVALFFGIWMLFKTNDTTFIEKQAVEQYVNTDKVTKDNDFDEPVKPSSVQNKPAVTTKKVNEVLVAKWNKTDSSQNTIVDKDAPIEEDVTKSAFENQIVQKTEVEIVEKKLVNHSNIEIYVNPNKLLRVAEMERQVDKASSEGQNFWRKVREVNSVVDNHLK